MRIAVTGASGFVGRHVTTLLAGRGHQVRALVRRDDPGRAAAALPAERTPGDLADPAALAALTRGADVIVHLVGIIVEAGAATFEAVHVEGTRRLLTAAREAGVRRFVHMSAVGARDEPGATRYHRTKWRAEELVRSSGLSHAIFRPSIISGPENRPIRTLARLHRWSPLVPVFGDGGFAMQPVWIGDVALAFALAAERPALSGVFELGGPATLTYEEFVRAIGRAAGHPRPLVHVPLAVARAAAAALGVMGPLAPLTLDQLQMLVEGSATPANALESTFGIWALPFDEGLARFLGGGRR
ncbi:MAG TPA: complex I NDUFA9 subunit family protein [Gemmatimonadales bacterium]|nr:complex I NDUFA9 subunit family protein [Gemmatimonadales bacterium]